MRPGKYNKMFGDYMIEKCLILHIKKQKTFRFCNFAFLKGFLNFKYKKRAQLGLGGVLAALMDRRLGGYTCPLKKIIA